MITYQPLTVLPPDIQADWRAALRLTIPTQAGAFRLVAIRRTRPKSYEEQRIIVSVVDENGFPMAGIRVAFAYDTAPDYHTVTPDFQWLPPEQRAFIVPTGGGGSIEQIQGDVVKEGQAGGITVFIWEPEYSSDFVTGCGQLYDHTGLALIFQLRRTGVTPLAERLTALDAWVTTFEGQLAAIEKRLDGLEFSEEIER